MRRSVVVLLVALPLLVGAWDVLQVSLLPNDELLKVCAGYYDRYAQKLVVLPRGFACSYLTRVRDPNPNQSLSGREGQTLFGYALSNHLINGATNESGSLAVIDHLLRRGVDWNRSHHSNLPPALHLAARERSPKMIERLLKAGADPRQKGTRADSEGFALDAFDYSSALRSAAGGRKNEVEVAEFLAIEALLCDDVSVVRHAQVGLQKLIFDSESHKLGTMGALEDWNLYPADNYDVLQGVISGPIGDHKSASFALVGVWDYENVGLPCVATNPAKPSDCSYDPRKAKAPSRLETVLVVHGDPTKDGDLGWIKSVKLTSRRSAKGRQARLLGVESMSVEDVDKDGQYEISAVARFAIGCHGKPFRESFSLKVTGDIVTRTQPILGLLGVAGGGDPLDLNGAKDLQDLLRIGQTAGPTCVGPVLPVRVEAPTEKSLRAWPIHSAGIGKLSADGPIPTWLLKREGKTLKQLLTDGRPADQMQAMLAGYIDQDGYRVISLESLDLRVRYSQQGRIMVLYPGKSLRTAEGTGLGSSLAELLGAHGSYTMTRWPEPYHCGVHVQGYKGVSFAFTTCEDACAGAKVERVVVSGEDPWGDASDLDRLKGKR
jgi:hypothetical protein